MQPQNQEYNGGQEQLPVQPTTGGEHIPVLPSPESGINTGAERREQTAELQAAAAGAAQSNAPQRVQPIAPPPQAAPVAPQKETSSTPRVFDYKKQPKAQPATKPSVTRVQRSGFAQTDDEEE